MDSTVLANVELFKDLAPEDREELAALMSEATLKRGEVLFQEGDSGDRLYLVVDGKVKLSHTAPDGRENLIAVLGPGEIIGELSLFDLQVRSSTVTAIAQTRLATLAHDEMRSFIEGHPKLAMSMLKALAGRLRNTNQQMADLVFSDVPGRVAKALLDLAERFGERTPEGIYVAHDLTQEELAHLVGASRETVNKSLADFTSRGWIRLEGRAVLLIQVQRLQRRAH